MANLDASVVDEVAALASDRTSGASRLIERAIVVLVRAISEKADREDARRRAHTLVAVTRAVARAQPSMGGFWMAAAVALAAGPSGGVEGLERLRRAVVRAPRALARVAAARLREGLPSGAPLHVVTCSFSGSVLACCTALAEGGSLTVSCGEGRPAMEGRRLAETLAATGIAVRFSTDGGLALALDQADAVLVGADAVTAEKWVNKVGSGPLAAAAAARGVPVFVVASREKFVPKSLAPLIAVADRPPEEIWSEAPAGVEIVNRYFEWVPNDWATAFITDTGMIGPDDCAEVCRANGSVVTPEVLEALT